jgi:hypothetical protein
MWEQWHQKLHNNTSPDDVAICQALIAFVEAGGEEAVPASARLDAYWRVLADQGVTRERLASFDRAITNEPQLAPEQRRTGDTDASLAADLRAYLKTLTAVHGGGDLASAAGAVLGFELPQPSGGKAKAIRVPPVPGVGDGEAGRRLKAAVDAVLEAQQALGGKKEADGADAVGSSSRRLALAHARVAALAVEARLLLEPALVSPAASSSSSSSSSSSPRQKDVLFLDQALDLAARTALEGGVQHARRAAREAAAAAAATASGGRRDPAGADDDSLTWLLDLITPAVENAALSSAPPGHLSDAAAAALHAAAEAAALAEWRAAAPMGEGEGEGEGGHDHDHHLHHHHHHHHHHPKNELALVLGHLHAIRGLPVSRSSNARALHAVAALERARRVVADGASALCAWLQPTADELARSALPQVPEQTVAMFGEEAVRGTAASCLAQLLAVAEPLARALAGQAGGWQVVSRGSGGLVIAGRLARAASLADVQHASFSEPTVLVVTSPVRGEEDVPKGVVAVLVVVAGSPSSSSSSSSWGGLDVLCHAAIRARNSGALLACCLDAEAAGTTLAALDDETPFVAVELRSGGGGNGGEEVRVRAATEAEVADGSDNSNGTVSAPPPPPPPPKEAAAGPPLHRLTLLAAHDFAPGLVGAKALNTALLSRSRDLPPFVALPPWSLALPAGAFDCALSDSPDNVPIAEALRDLSAAADAALEAGDAEGAASALALARGAVLRMRAPEALARAFSAAVAEAAWEEHVSRRERRAAAGRRRRQQCLWEDGGAATRQPSVETTGDETDEGLLPGAGASLSPLSQRPSVASWAAAAGDAAWSSAWPAIRRVWASQFNMRARVALRKNGTSTSQLRMAVLLQPLLPASRAFVAHTRSPLGGGDDEDRDDDDDDQDDDEVYVEAVQGLGETLVGAHPGRALGGAVRRSALRKAAAAGQQLLQGKQPPAAPSSPRELARAVRVLSVPSKSVVLKAPGLLAPPPPSSEGESGSGDDADENDAKAGQLALAAAARLFARSDSNCEDLPGFAGAGLFDSHPSRPAVPALADVAADALFFFSSSRGGEGDGDDEDDGLHAARLLLWDLAAASLAVEDALAVGGEEAAAQDVEGAVVEEGGVGGSGGASGAERRRVYVVQARPQV